MGVELHLPCTVGALDWLALRDELARCGVVVQLRMIDGELAFPDEVPKEGWRELRISAEAGMITIVRDEEGVRLITWGTADPALLAFRDQVASAITARGTSCRGFLESPPADHEAGP
jgi:hypothetical protein